MDNKTINVKLPATTEDNVKLAEVKKLTGDKSNNQVFRQAFTVYCDLLSKRESGAKVIVREADGNEWELHLKKAVTQSS